jgi:hypothetical protein
MNLNDLIGIAGVALILAAYFLSIFNYIKKEGRLYFLMNIVGAALAGFASWLIHYWPFVILEAVWVIVSVAGIISHFKDR